MSSLTSNNNNSGPRGKGELPPKKGTFTLTREYILLILGIVVIGSVLMITFGKSGNSLPTTAVTDTVPAPESNEITKLNSLERDLENKLQTTLSRMSGVGQVEVSVSLYSGLKSNYARNENITKRTSKETDKASGTRETTEVTENNQLVMPNGVSQPVMVMEERPEVAGVLVIAEGAKDPIIKETIHMSLKTLLDIPAVKISVEAMGGV
ncbi:MAG: stage III sporulation protein AH [Desulfitobacteriaceae bacterium]|nr:stage III sporulation protein AH [Desulfitobacteriaceae bacterium]MDD4346105.1 stage III sporulation protein AH [Desulfitobacteriaceae bacterium]MDD4401065.1 stage III sporulation protein AH [Desulfitobacteriaceae bacterium]